MHRYIILRVFHGLVALFIVSIVVFALSRAAGDPAALMVPVGASNEEVERVRAVLGLDKPYMTQYWLFISHAVIGDFGKSLRQRQPVTGLILKRFPNSMKLAALSLFFCLLVALPLGVVAAVKKDSGVDTVAKVVAILGQSMPSFWVGILFIEIFAVQLGWLPSSNIGGIKHYILPGLTTGWFLMAGIMRLLRSSMLEVLDSDFVKMARIKGVSERMVVLKHALRNALIPVATFGGMYFALILTASVVVETVFSWPGLGRLVYEAIMGRDYPVIQGVVLTAAAMVIAVNLMIDIAYSYIDPRIRYGE